MKELVVRIVVTGGAGFIGSAVVRQAIGLGHEVINVDAMTYAASSENVKSVEENPLYHFQHFDIRDRTGLINLIASIRPNAVMHLAAESHVDRSIDGPSDFLETNLIGTYNLLEACRAYWTDAGKPDDFRLHHISTDEVFGSLGNGGFFTETTAYAPNNPYAATKAGSDHLVRSWHKTYELPVVMTNCSNNYGPFQFPEKLIPVTILRALKGETLEIYGDGKHVRDWLFVEDHARALLKVVTEAENGRSYTIGGDGEATNIKIVELICELLDSKRPQSRSYAEQIKFVADRPGHDRRYAIDYSRINLELDWSPSIDLHKGLDLTIDWYLANKDWWRTLLSRKGVGQRVGLGSSD